MFRAPLRRIRPASLPATRLQAPRRLASTGPVKKGTWKGTAARWGVALGAVYFYNTSPLFADDPAPQVKIPVNQDEEVTVDKVIEEKRKEIEARAREREAKAAREAEAEKAKTKETDEKTKTQETDIASEGATPEGSPQALEEEAGQQAAFNPETGEINWDCPCLGGMAHGPCGEEFRAAFSCFVYSEEEPKGMDCIDKFQGMQDCFRQHPEVYGAELADEEAAEAEARAEVEAGSAKADEPKPEEENAQAEEKPAEKKPAEKKPIYGGVEPADAPTEKAEKEDDRKAEASAEPR